MTIICVQQITSLKLKKISDDLSHLKGIDMVMSASRPAGKRVDDIYIKNQAGQVNDGVGQATDGVGEVKKRFRFSKFRTQKIRAGP